MRIADSSVSVPPPLCEAGAEKIIAYSSRPPGGGPICLVHFYAGDLREVVPPFDARTLPDFGDTALATPFISTFTGTLKAFVSYIPAGGGNDRLIEVIDTGHVPTVTA